MKIEVAVEQPINKKSGKTIPQLIAEQKTGIFKMANNGEGNTFLVISHPGSIGSEISYFVWNGSGVLFRPINYHNSYWDKEWVPVETTITIILSTSDE